MKRMVLAGILGGLVYFAWGMAAWMVLGIHSTTIKPLPMDLEVTAALTDSKIDTGVYSSPTPANPEEMTDKESSFYKSHLAGPVYMVYYNAEGSEPMGMGMMVRGLVFDMMAALLAACLLSSALGDCQSYAKRVGFVVGLAVFVALVAHAAYWNWMRFPSGYTINFIVDIILGWTIAGLVIGAIVKPNSPVVPAAGAVTAATESPITASNPKAAPTPPPQPVRNDAITLLATLQREARFIDIVKEPLSDYSDAQIGAAARDVLRDCGTVLERLFDLQPIVDQEEGANIDVPSGFDTGRFRITGNVAGEAPYQGPLVHHGWEAKKCSLPQWTGSSDAANIVAPAELEIK